MNNIPNPEAANQATPKAGPTYKQMVALVVFWLKLFIEPGQVTELRTVKTSTPSYRRNHTEAGFFDYEHLESMAKNAIELSKVSTGVYFVMNPLDPVIIHRCFNEVKPADSEGGLAKDQNILRRKWILIDVDVERIEGVSSTDAEKALTLEVIQEVRQHLKETGWKEPIFADSGNGYHALYRVYLPTDDGGLVRDILRSLASKFNRDRVKIDTSVFNPARICKLPGTKARKGSNTKERPHRTAKILEIPGLATSIPPEVVNVQ